MVLIQDSFYPTYPFYMHISGTIFTSRICNPFLVSVQLLCYRQQQDN